MAAGLRVRRVHSPDPGRCACQLRSVGGSVHQQQSHRLQSRPWNYGKYGEAMRQYTSNGRINGYNGPLDLNYFRGTREQWDKYANPGKATKPTPTPAPQPAPSVDYEALATATIRGDYGQRRNPQGRVGCELRAGHAHRQPEAQRIRSIRACRFHPERERDRA